LVLGLVEARIGEYTIYVMSEDQLSALLTKLKNDTGLQERLKGAADLDEAVVIAKEAGFDISKADWLKHKATKQTWELTDDELEGVAAGGSEYAQPKPTDSGWRGGSRVERVWLKKFGCPSPEE
jgi:predicted ribosomally synthesized peptide with nif11-like leader